MKNIKRLLLGLVLSVGLVFLSSSETLALISPSSYPANPTPQPPAGVYYVKSMPSGAYTGMTPKGVILMFHMGGWGGYDQAKTNALNARAAIFNSWGYETINADYGFGQNGMYDIVAFYDWALTENLPVCAYGESSGAHMSVMLSVVRPNLDCVVGAAGPMDLNSWVNKSIASGKFSNLTDWSPVSYGYSISSLTLLGYAASDYVVDTTQGNLEKQANASVQVLNLNAIDLRDNTPVPFVHSNVPRAQYNNWLSRVRSTFDLGTN